MQCHLGSGEFFTEAFCGWPCCVCADLLNVLPAIRRFSDGFSSDSQDSLNAGGGRLIVDAQQHCLFMTEQQRLDQKVAGFRLKPNHQGRIR
jgi:hypothetical protein